MSSMYDNPNELNRTPKNLYLHLVRDNCLLFLSRFAQTAQMVGWDLRSFRESSHKHGHYDRDDVTIRLVGRLAHLLSIMVQASASFHVEHCMWNTAVPRENVEVAEALSNKPGVNHNAR